MDKIDINQAVLFFTIIFGVTQSVLDRRGIGRVEYLPDSKKLLGLMALDIPLNLLSGIGLIVITIWSFFMLNWINAIVIASIGFLVWSIILAIILALLMQSEAWESILIIGIPLQIVNKLITSGGVLFLVWTYLK